MTKPESLDFPPLHCSLDPELGDYYQDFRPALRLVEEGYHGAFDDAGVPVVRYGQGRMSHNATTIAQYALANQSAARAGDVARSERARTQLDWLVAAQEPGGPYAGCWPMRHDDPKYTWLKAPWISALASGQALSTLLRGWQELGDARYREAADLAYRGLHDAPGLVLDPGDELWYEEYPADPPLHVLNGHVYALLGVLDYARATGDAEARERWERSASTVLANLRRFDLGFWSAYDLLDREPASVHYQKNIHIPQLRILGKLTGDPTFDEFAARWEGQLHSRVSRARYAVALRIHARRGWRRRR
jgi:heparosan-N-sulfate-glucuronate 5-epimerase